MNIPFSPPDITDLEIAEVVAAMKSGWITTGPKTKLFEKKIAEYVGCTKAACLNSATAAMELTLRILGIGPGDEVITSAYTYTASASVIFHVGAKIILVDTAPDSFEMDYEKLADAITERTKAIIPVDIGGVMCDYDKVFKAVDSKKHLFKPANDIQKLYNRVIVIADSAHSFGATYHGKSSGQVADFTCFSFHAVKNLTTAEGGAVVWREVDGLDSEELYHQFMLYSLHGQSKDALAKTKLGSWEYDIIYPGYKCNMTDILAGFGLVQLSRFNGLRERRNQIIRMYDNYLLPLGINRLEHFGNDYTGNGHLYLTRIPGIDERRRNEIIIKMAEQGIATNVHFKPLPMHTAYKKLGFDINEYPNSYRQYQNQITLPLHTLLKDEEVQYIACTLMNILREGKAPDVLRADGIIYKRVWENDSDSIESIYRIYKECGEKMFLEQGLLHWADPLPVEKIKEMCLNEEVYALKDKKRDKVVATYSVTMQPSVYFDPQRRATYLGRIAVSPELWRHGLATLCINAIIQFAKENGCECIRATVYEKSTIAIEFFRKMGFVSLYERPTKHFIVKCLEKNLQIKAWSANNV